MGYIALKPMEVDGTERKLGDSVPEAATWTNVQAYVRCGELAYVPDGSEQKVKEMLENGWVPPPGMLPHSLPLHVHTAAMSSQPVGSGVKHAQPQPEPATEAELSEDDLLRMSRAELNKLAADYMVEDPEKLPNKLAVVEAILGG